MTLHGPSTHSQLYNLQAFYNHFHYPLLQHSTVIDPLSLLLLAILSTHQLPVEGLKQRLINFFGRDSLEHLPFFHASSNYPQFSAPWGPCIFRNLTEGPCVLLSRRSCLHFCKRHRRPSLHAFPLCPFIAFHQFVSLTLAWPGSPPAPASASPCSCFPLHCIPQS